MNQPIILTNGQHEIKIYTVQNRGRSVFQLSYYEGGKRERQTFAKVSDARREAKLVLGRLALNVHDVAELSSADMESYVVARKHVEPTGLPLHVCAELFAQAHAKLAGRSLAGAVDFFLSFHPAESEVKPLVDLITDFAEGRRKMGVAADYVQNIKRQLGRHDLSDEAVVARWVENPYWQHFGGRQFFEHELPIDPSSMTRWRKRLGEAGAEAMLKATIDAAVAMKALRPSQVTHVNVDTTVQTKAVRHPTDARLYDRARERLVKQARQAGLTIKQSYERVGRRLVMMAGRYAHARQMRRSKACTRKLRTNLGRVLREIERQGVPEALRLFFDTSKRIHAQKRTDQSKVYSVHEPQTACIAKGKAGRKYEFGQKASVAATSKGGWLVGAKCMPGNPYDGHTLKEQMAQVERVCIKKEGIKTIHVDMGYRGHDYDGPAEVLVDRRRRGEIPKRVWRWMKRRSAVEPTIGHLKSDYRLERNRLRGGVGDALNVLLSAAAMNFAKLLRFVLAFWRLLLAVLFSSAPSLRFV